MSNYLVNHQKKLRIFAKREQELIHAIRQGNSPEELVVAAERVREAKVSVFKCKFAQNTLYEPRRFDIEELATKTKKLHFGLE